MEEDINKLIENNNKLIKKISEQDKSIEELHELYMKLVAFYSEMMKQFQGLSTALIGSGILTKEGVELHTSFKPKLPEGITAEPKNDENKVYPKPKQSEPPLCFGKYETEKNFCVSICKYSEKCRETQKSSKV